MKRILFNHKTCMCLVMMCLTGAAWGQTFLNSLQFQPYLGLEYQYEHIRPSKPYRNLLATDIQTGNLFVGTKFLKNLGLEVGYYRNLKVQQQQYVTPSFNNAPASGPTAILTRTSYKGFSADFSAYVPLDAQFYASIIAGFVTMHPTITFEAWGGTNLASAFPLIKTKNRTVPRLGMGLEMLKQHWGLRSRIFWVYTQDIQFNVAAAQRVFPAITPYPYVQAVQVTAGVFYRF